MKKIEAGQPGAAGMVAEEVGKLAKTKKSPKKESTGGGSASPKKRKVVKEERGDLESEDGDM